MTVWSEDDTWGLWQVTGDGVAADFKHYKGSVLAATPNSELQFQVLHISGFRGN